MSDDLRITEEQLREMQLAEFRRWYDSRFHRDADRHDRRIAFTTRISVLERANEHCEYCGRFVAVVSRHILELHHLTYKRAYGAELPTDLVALCRACHKQTHGL